MAWKFRSISATDNARERYQRKVKEKKESEKNGRETDD